MENVNFNVTRSLVGLRGVDASARSWVNDIAGLSTELVSDLAQPSDMLGMQSDDTSEKAVWESVHREAYKRLVSESLLQLSENYDFQPTIARTAEPQRAKPATVLTGPGLFLGTLVTIPYEKNAVINLHSLTVFVTPHGSPSNQVISSFVRVYDADTNALYYSAPHDIQFGVNTIVLNQQFRTLMLEPLRLLVVIDSSGLYLTELIAGWSNADCDYLIEGKRTLNPADLENALFDEKTYMSLDIEVTRSLDSLLMRYAADLTTAYGYLCGSLLMTEKLGTPNLSVFTLSNPQFTERMESKLLDDFKRALRPVVRRLSNELLPQKALTVPVATPSEITYVQGSYV